MSCGDVGGEGVFVPGGDFASHHREYLALPVLSTLRAMCLTMARLKGAL